MMKNNTSKSDRQINMVSIVCLAIFVVIVFSLFYGFYMPIDFDNLGGKHAWVSASTIKYVNMWLQEGAANLHFTNYEYFPSIEFETMADRLPYVSYPTGVTFMVWLGAKICGQSHIDISFLKHFQLIMYGLENVMMAVLVYSIASRCWKVNEKAKVLIAALVSIFWMTLPVNNWFLTNIYWTDLAVFLWLIAFLLLECLSDKTLMSGKLRTAVIIKKSLVIFAGVMTEYYFWIVVFIAFVFHEIGTILSSVGDTKKKVKDAFISGLQYVIPVIIGLIIYVWQMSYTEDWIRQIADTFLHRTGASENEASMSMLVTNFLQAITCGSNIRAILLVGVEVAVLVVTVWVFVKKTEKREWIFNKSLVVILLMCTTPLLQILIFSNHSAIHQYAMTKLGLQIVGVILVVVSLVQNIQDIDNRYAKWIGYCACGLGIIGVLTAMGYPGQTKKFYYEKNSQLDYSIDQAIHDNMGYEDVCFSFTYGVLFNPPMDLAISEKAVYLLEDITDAESMFDNLSEQARKVLVIDKNNIGSNDYVDVEKTEDIIRQEQACIDAGEIIYEDESCILVTID